jgi:hypothetical protein
MLESHVIKTPYNYTSQYFLAVQGEGEDKLYEIREI